jgi:hypothetical protein
MPFVKRDKMTDINTIGLTRERQRVLLKSRTMAEKLPVGTTPEAALAINLYRLSSN